jgi:rhodanese-related sulfurtransferase
MNQSDWQISVNDLAGKRALLEPHILLDVREPWELELSNIDGSVNIPMHLIPDKLNELTKTQEIIVMCHHGGRSQQVAQFLLHHGYSKVFNLIGGIHAWSKEIDPSIPQY